VHKHKSSRKVGAVINIRVKQQSVDIPDYLADKRQMYAIEHIGQTKKGIHSENRGLKV
jgi:hypothetical protein